MPTRRTPANPALLPATGPVRTPARLLLIGLCLETAFAVPYRSVHVMVESLSLAWTAGLLGVVLALAAYAFRAPIAAACVRLDAWVPGKHWFTGWLLFGLVARPAWGLLLHTVPKADGATYYEEATALAVKHAYKGGFYPPGLPLVEAPFLMGLGVHHWVTILYAMLTFAGTYLALAALGLRVGGRRVAALACALVALWPNDIALTGINEKEPLIGLFLTTAFLLYVKSRETPAIAGAGFLALAGVLGGFAALTQPGYLLFPSVILLNELLRDRRWPRVIGRTVLFTLAMLLAVSPWTLRNYHVYHRFVLISTNGGDVFYRANNPLANGQYTYKGEETLPSDDFAASAEGYRLAKLWIRQHPGDFAKLMVRKQIVYLGDEGNGVYESLKRDRHPSNLVYGVLKLFFEAFWMAIFVFVFVASSWLFRTPDWRPLYGLCVLPLLYQWCIDSVFEAGPRHHGPYFALISLLVAVAISSASRRAAKGASSAASGEVGHELAQA